MSHSMGSEVGALGDEHIRNLDICVCTWCDVHGAMPSSHDLICGDI